MIFIDDSTDSPAFEDIIDFLIYLGHVKYDTADIHNQLGDRLIFLAKKHYDRADNLCKIVKHKGKQGPQQLKLIDKIIKKFNTL